MYEGFGVIKYYYKAIDLHFPSQIPLIALLFVVLCGATTAALKHCQRHNLAEDSVHLRKVTS